MKSIRLSQSYLVVNKLSGYIEVKIHWTISNYRDRNLQEVVEVLLVFNKKKGSIASLQLLEWQAKDPINLIISYT